MNRLEYDEELKKIYKSTKKEPFFVDVPKVNYLCFDGIGHPSDEDFQIACEALYTLSYIIKFDVARKKLDVDYKVNPMEVTWYLDKKQDGIDFTWTMMIMQPDFVTKEILNETIKIAISKGKSISSERVNYKQLDFGKCIQCFHRGDYNNMNNTLKKMQEFAAEHGLSCDQYTHDIYLNDMRKTKVENYKTIMRVKTHPMQCSFPYS